MKCLNNSSVQSDKSRARLKLSGGSCHLFSQGRGRSGNAVVFVCSDMIVEWLWKIFCNTVDERQEGAMALLWRLDQLLALKGYSLSLLTPTFNHCTVWSLQIEESPYLK